MVVTFIFCFSLFLLLYTVSKEVWHIGLLSMELCGGAGVFWYEYYCILYFVIAAHWLAKKLKVRAPQFTTSVLTFLKGFLHW